LKAPRKGAFFFDAMAAPAQSCRAFRDNPAYPSGTEDNLHPEGAGQRCSIAFFQPLGSPSPMFRGLNLPKKALYFDMNFMQKRKR
jgi:hypothetical protein